MEPALEGILETVLVGSIASLCLLCSLFLLLPKMIRVQGVRAIFKVLLYEEEQTAHGQSSPPPALEATGIEADRIFISLLLLATVYGAGIIAEALSDSITSSRPPDGAASMFFSSDPEIRADAFEGVGRVAVTAGHVMPQLAEFMADYAACRAQPAEHLETGQTCQAIRDRASAFYYTAKNMVFREETYFQELSRMQSRIDFTRAVSQSLVVLGAILFFGALCAALAEWQRDRKPVRVSEPAWRAWLFDVYQEQRKHWLRLAAVRMFLMSGLVLLIAWPSQKAWHENEEEFDRRVFGYFLASMGRSNEGEPVEDGCAEDTVSPISPYRVFGIEAGERFEPSAIDALGEGKRVIVANDKGGNHPFVLFDFDESSGFRNASLVEELGIPVGKMESLHVTPSVDGGPSHVLSASTFELSANGAGRLISFDVWNDGRVSNPVPEEIDNPCMAVSKEGACKIEGLSSRDAQKEILFGVRSTGIDPEKPEPRVAVLLATKQADGKWTTALLWQAFLRAPPNSGISSLELDRRGNLLLLTTTEVNESPAQANQVTGALWRIARAELEAAIESSKRPAPPPKAVLVQTFIHKPEGLAVLDNHTIVAVFDDDGARKSRTYAPETFALDQHQSVYTVVRAAAP